MIVITAGEKYVDIDALACAAAYQELLGLGGKKSEIVFPGILNHSVSELAQKQNFQVSNKIPDDITGYVIVDVSEPSHIATFVEPNNTLEIFDHHYGFADFWEEKIGKENAHIEMIGACATLIWEEFVKRDFDKQISTSSANLLTLAITSNTFDLGSPLTHQRDVDAYEELQKYTDLPKNWKELYYMEQESFIFENPKEAIVNDTKIQEIPPLDKPLVIGQIELWNGSDFIQKYVEDIRVNLSQYDNPYWMMNVPSIGEKRNYIYSENKQVQELLSKITGCKFENNLCITDRLILRKEILKSLYSLK